MHNQAHEYLLENIAILPFDKPWDYYSKMKPMVEGKITALCTNNAEIHYPCYISLEGRDEKENGKQSNGLKASWGWSTLAHVPRSH